MDGTNGEHKPPTDNGGDSGGKPVYTRSELAVLERALKKNQFRITDRTWVELPAILEAQLTEKRADGRPVLSPRNLNSRAMVLLRMAGHNQKEDERFSRADSAVANQAPTINVQGDVNIQQNNTKELTAEERAKALANLMGVQPVERNGHA
jgi:hypothetical protein